MLYRPEESGQGLMEYGLVLVLIAILLVVVVAILGDQINALFVSVTDAIP